MSDLASCGHKIDAVDRGGQQPPGGLLQSPAGITYTLHTDEPPTLQQEQAVIRSYVFPAIQVGNGQDFAQQTFLGCEMGIRRRYRHAEHTVLRSAPELPVPVIAQIDHAVGTKTVRLGDGVELPPFVVGNRDALSALDDGLESIAQRLFLGDVIQDLDLVVIIYQVCLHNVRQTDVQRVFADDLLHLHLVSAYLVDLTVVDQEMQAVVTLPYFLHLATEQVAVGQTAEVQFAIGLDADLSEVVIATHPDGVVVVTIDHRHTGKTRRMDDSPLGLVVIEHAFEVGDKDDTVLRNTYVEVAVMGLIVVRKIVTEVRDALGKDSSQ